MKKIRGEDIFLPPTRMCTRGRRGKQGEKILSPLLARGCARKKREGRKWRRRRISSSSPLHTHSRACWSKVEKTKAQRRRRSLLLPLTPTCTHGEEKETWRGSPSPPYASTCKWVGRLIRGGRERERERERERGDRYYVAYKLITLSRIMFMFIEMKFIHCHSCVMFAMKSMSMCND